MDPNTTYFDNSVVLLAPPAGLDIGEVELVFYPTCFSINQTTQRYTHPLGTGGAPVRLLEQEEEVIRQLGLLCRASLKAYPSRERLAQLIEWCEGYVHQFRLFNKAASLYRSLGNYRETLLAAISSEVGGTD